MDQSKSSLKKKDKVMLKKIVLASSLIAPFLVAVPTAEARGLCHIKLQEDLMECISAPDVSQCEIWADMEFLECLSKQYATKDPIDP